MTDLMERVAYRQASEAFNPKHDTLSHSFPPPGRLRYPKGTAPAIFDPFSAALPNNTRRLGGGLAKEGLPLVKLGGLYNDVPHTNLDNAVRGINRALWPLVAADYIDAALPLLIPAKPWHFGALNGWTLVRDCTFNGAPTHTDFYNPYPRSSSQTNCLTGQAAGSPYPLVQLVANSCSFAFVKRTQGAPNIRADNVAWFSRPSAYPAYTPVVVPARPVVVLPAPVVSAPVAAMVPQLIPPMTTRAPAFVPGYGTVKKLRPYFTGREVGPAPAGVAPPVTIGTAIGIGLPWAMHIVFPPNGPPVVGTSPGVSPPVIGGVDPYVPPFFVPPPPYIRVPADVPEGKVHIWQAPGYQEGKYVVDTYTEGQDLLGALEAGVPDGWLTSNQPRGKDWTRNDESWWRRAKDIQRAAHYGVYDYSDAVLAIIEQNIGDYMAAAGPRSRMQLRKNLKLPY